MLILAGLWGGVGAPLQGPLGKSRTGRIPPAPQKNSHFEINLTYLQVKIYIFSDVGMSKLEEK